MTEKTDNPIMVTTTFEDRNQAEKMAAKLLQQRLIACGQISGPVTSSYWWKDQVTTSTEFILAMKSTTSCYKRLEQAVLAGHPYDVPEIVAIPIVNISDTYLNWLYSELAR